MDAQPALTAVPSLPPLSDWEAAWAPYDEDTYTAVLAAIQPDDVVLDIGAGDLRLARRIAAVAGRVVAIEQQPDLTGGPCPPNLTILHGDARALPFPPDVSVAVLLMRHCTHLALYLDRLTAVGSRCRTLITNARWGFGVEQIDLRTPRIPFDVVACGWYACRCGATGFIPGPPAALTAEREAQIHEVASCPGCRNTHVNG